MDLVEFKQRVKKAFGERMEHATPANVREFLDGLQREEWMAQRLAGRSGALHEIKATSGLLTWESLIREFFQHALEMDHDQALILLWLFGLDLAYSGIEEVQADSMDGLFR